MLQISQFLTHHLSNSVQLLRDKLEKYRKFMSGKPVTFLLLVTAFGAAGVGIWSVYARYVSLQTLVLATGNPDGESFQISNALMKVVEQHKCKLQELPTNILTGKLCLNFKIEVVPTHGTEENLQDLEEKKNMGEHDHADLATAQADVVADQVGKSSTSSARTIATLYTDTFQLVVKNSLIPQNPPKTDELTFPFSILKGKRIGVPKLGGQRISFLSIAKHNGFSENDFEFVDRETDLCSGDLDAIFRVRTLGNSGIENSLRDEKFSQESFRTFNEVYKTTREYIERAIESAQRQKSEEYINEIMHLLDFDQTEPEILLEQLDQILIAAKNELTEDHVFSRESFRTFIEAHNLVKEALDRRQRTLELN